MIDRLTRISYLVSPSLCSNSAYLDMVTTACWSSKWTPRWRGRRLKRFRRWIDCWCRTGWSRYFRLQSTERQHVLGTRWKMHLIMRPGSVRVGVQPEKTHAKGISLMYRYFTFALPISFFGFFFRFSSVRYPRFSTGAGKLRPMDHMRPVKLSIAARRTWRNNFNRE